ncbi:hypothetical protein BMS3Bbin10_01512 [bacterium BMS3Bbin10]|nr:hypothetical protein BMS3Bbin10_01512 [bacterium BMS3Bbin10]
MVVRNRPGETPAMAGPDRAMDLEPRVSVSLLIWAVLAILSGLAIFAGAGMFQARSALDKTSAALARAEGKAKETDLLLKHALDQKEQALADKRQVIKELSAQGNRLAEFSQGEEKAKSALAVAFTGTEAAQKRIAALTREVADLKKNLAAARGGRSKLTAEISALKTDLAAARAELEMTRAELQRSRAAAEPYRAP